MTAKSIMSGILSPVLTPFKDDLSPDTERLIGMCRWLASQNCGLAVFGTTSEANSLSVDERIELLDALIDDGIDPAIMMPGTGCCSFVDSVRLTRHAVSRGVGGVLMLPPFYYKEVSDEGLFRNYAEIIERVGDERLRIYLYHFPKMSGTPITPGLIGRLIDAYPGTVVGIKDSSGDWSNMEAILKAFPGFALFSGTESLLLANMRGGGAGTITATANINPAAIHALYVGWQTAEAEKLQQAVDQVRQAVQQYPLFPGLKFAMAHYSGDPVWGRLRPPLVELDPDEGEALVAKLDEAGFDGLAGFGG